MFMENFAAYGETSMSQEKQGLVKLYIWCQIIIYEPLLLGKQHAYMMNTYVCYCKDKQQPLDCFNTSIYYSIYVSKIIGRLSARGSHMNRV